MYVNGGVRKAMYGSHDEIYVNISHVQFTPVRSCTQLNEISDCHYQCKIQV